MRARAREEEHDINHAPRRPKPPPPSGIRPEVLKEPVAALSAVSRDYGAPLLTPDVLVGGPSHDDKTIAILSRASLKKGEEEESRER